MRNLVFVALASSLFPVADADACGPPEPRVLRLVQHWTFDNHARLFALTGERVRTPYAWENLPVASYDHWQIAPGGPATLAAVTLIGPRGSRVVTPSRRVFLLADRELPLPTGALELPVPEGDFQIALAGKHRASWLDLDPIAGERSDAAVWLIGQHVNAYGAGLLDEFQIAGTPLTAVTIIPPRETQPITFVRSGKDSLGRYDGSPVAAFVADGVRYLVIRSHDELQTVALGR